MDFKVIGLPTGNWQHREDSGVSMAGGSEETHMETGCGSTDLLDFLGEVMQPYWEQLTNEELRRALRCAERETEYKRRNAAEIAAYADMQVSRLHDEIMTKLRRRTSNTNVARWGVELGDLAMKAIARALKYNDNQRLTAARLNCIISSVIVDVVREARKHASTVSLEGLQTNENGECVDTIASPVDCFAEMNEKEALETWRKVIYQVLSPTLADVTWYKLQSNATDLEIAYEFGFVDRLVTSVDITQAEKKAAETVRKRITRGKKQLRESDAVAELAGISVK